MISHPHHCTFSQKQSVVLCDALCVAPGMRLQRCLDPCLGKVALPGTCRGVQLPRQMGVLVLCDVWVKRSRQVCTKEGMSRCVWEEEKEFCKQRRWLVSWVEGAEGLFGETMWEQGNERRVSGRASKVRLGRLWRSLKPHGKGGFHHRRGGVLRGAYGSVPPVC